MSDDRDILEQADRLMRRHRVFLAGSQASVPVIEEVPDDLPVLTDLVMATEPEVVVPPPAPVEPIESVEQRAQVLAHELLLERLSAQRQAIEEELGLWLDNELPHIVTYVIDGIADQLVAQVTAAVRLELLPKLQIAVESAESQPSRDGSSD
jgi:hypothetical protein